MGIIFDSIKPHKIILMFTRVKIFFSAFVDLHLFTSLFSIALDCSWGGFTHCSEI